MRDMRVPISGQVTGAEEANNALSVLLSNHYGGGKWTDKFERGLADFFGLRFASFCNSGSSANLLALASLELPKGSRILTSAVNFPTTVNAVIQLGYVPVFVDADPKTLNAVDIEGIEADAGIFAHTLGNPMRFGDAPFPIIEDCCDALGSTIDGQMVGKRGVMATLSFYPAHHITTGEGGAVLYNDPKLKVILESYRDWGRGCWCPPGKDNTCGKRFNGDYDHKYTYDRIGWNLKASDIQAAIGVGQLTRLEKFIERRKKNWQYLHDHLNDLPIDIIEGEGEPSWFGFAFLTDRRNELQKYLDSQDIGNRPIMAGNLLRQPAYKDVDYEVIGSLNGADEIHERGLWVGCFPGLNKEHLDITIEVMRDFYS